jgi:hypothetical protein
MMTSMTRLLLLALILFSSLAPAQQGPAIGEDVSGMIPGFAQRTGPKGLFVLFVRSADW